MTELQNLMDVLQSIPFYLQLLVGVSIAAVVVLTALGAIIAWQLSGVAKAIRESAHLLSQHNLAAAQPPRPAGPQQPYRQGY